jgi:hypothetical protein
LRGFPDSLDDALGDLEGFPAHDRTRFLVRAAEGVPVTGRRLFPGRRTGSSGPAGCLDP